MGTELTFNWRVHGHKDQLLLLERAITDQTLAHGYIFSGPSHIGKRTIARRLAQILLCASSNACDNCPQCKTLDSGSNADYLEFSSKDDLKIETIRELGYKLALKPYNAAYKVAVIDNAHNLTTEASNALLKVLEEPKPHTILILVTDNSHRLLPTISSRAQKINFGPLSKETFDNWMTRQGFSLLDESFVGRPGFAFNFSDESLQLELQDKSETLKRFLSLSDGSRLLLASELSEKDSTELKKLFEYWLIHLQRMLKENPSAILLKKIKGVLRAERLLDQNVNSKLLLSELMINAN
jgi:DNA polymerase III subunit delta'